MMRRFGGSLAIAWQGVRRRPLRNLLTAFSLLVGVLAVMLIQGGGGAVRDAIVRDSVLQSGSATTLQVSLTPQPDRLANLTEWKGLLSRATADQQGRTAGMLVADGVTVQVGGVIATDLSVRLTDPDLRELRPFPLVRGSWLTGDPTVAPVAVANTVAWERLPWSAGDAALVIGTSRQPVRLRLAGVVYDGGDLPTIYVDLAGSGRWAAVLHDQAIASVYVHSPTLGESALTQRVRTVMTVSGRADEVGGVQRVDRLDQYADQLATTQRVFLAIAALSLLVGSVGILNIGLATLRERSDELSLRRSFGATSPEVARIMILESQIVAVAAAVVAMVIAAVVLPAALRAAGPEYPLGPPTLPVTAMVTGLLVSCGAALAGALAPAIRAARVPIASIMRV
ncbi:MAG TPA: ABC transporter permease [Natronosporangium sp.]|jgi:putative ABC transport system permease protein|nr:ABC transporter permease [Natronosporangium sp.]